MKCQKPSCRRVAAAGRVRCEYHLAKQREYQARRKARGLCPCCNTHTGGTVCDRHKAWRLANDRAKRGARQRAGHAG